jgi:hypothetical protein
MRVLWYEKTCSGMHVLIKDGWGVVASLLSRLSLVTSLSCLSCHVSLLSRLSLVTSLSCHVSLVLSVCLVPSLAPCCLF